MHGLNATAALLVLACITGAAQASEVRLPTDVVLGVVGGSVPADGVAAATDVQFEDAGRIALELGKVTLADGDFLVLSGVKSGDWQIVTGDDLSPEGTFSTAWMESDLIRMELVSTGKNLASTATVTALRLDFADESSAGYRRARAEKFYQDYRLTQGLAATGGLVARGPELKVIYGNDDRVDTYTVTDPNLKRVAESSCGLVSRSSLTAQGSNWQVSSGSWTSAGGGTLCSDEPFRGQPVAPWCTGFLVAPDMIVTAGHCIETASECSSTAFVFGWAMQSASDGPVNPAPGDKVYFCASIVDQALAGNNDHCLVKLDRPVEGISPLSIRRSGSISNNTPLVVIGQPSGLPQKVAGGAVVKDAKNGIPYFQANLDTYGGNSGSPVFNAQTLQVEGILVRGATDFRTRSGSSCTESNRVPDTGSPTGLTFEEVSKIEVLVPLIPPLAQARGQLTFDRTKYSPTATARLTLLDSDLIGNPSQSVQLAYPGGTINVQTTADATIEGQFNATLNLGALALTDGAVITATYQDASDGTGPAAITTSASIDAVAPALQRLEVTPIGQTSAQAFVQSSEPVRISMKLSATACGNADITVNTSDLVTTAVLGANSLTKSTNYFYRLTLTDEAGNVTTVPSEEGCLHLRTREATDYLAALYQSNAYPLANRTLVFTPGNYSGGYTVTQRAATQFPVDAALGDAVSMGDDDDAELVLANGATFPFYGREYRSLFAISNGSVTLGTSDTAYNPTVGNHFLVPRISAHFTDLDPTSGGTIRIGQDATKAWVTWDSVPYYQSTSTVTAQVVLGFDGTIMVTILTAPAPVNVITGLASGRYSATSIVNTNFAGAPDDAQRTVLAQYLPGRESEAWELVPLTNYDTPTTRNSGDGLAVQVNGSRQTVGFLERNNAAIGSGADSITRVRYSIASSLIDSGLVPSFRLRVSPTEFGHSWISHISSSDYGTHSPGMATVEYTQLFAPVGDGLGRIDMDLVATDALDAATAELILGSVTVDSFPVSALAGPGTLVWESMPDGVNPWAVTTLPDDYDPAILTQSGSGLTARGKNSGAVDPARTAVGFFTSPLGVTLAEGSIYRFDFTLTGEAAAGESASYPTVRLRVNDETYMTSAMIVVDGAATSNPLPTVGESRTYSLYYEAPAGFAGRRVMVSFDYIWSGDGRDASLPITLQRVGAYQFNRAW